MNLNQLVAERPVIKEVICFTLNNRSQAERDRQAIIWKQIMDLRSGKTLEIIKLEDEEIIRISIKDILKWIGDFTTHMWYSPIQRLIKVLNGEEAEKEPDEHKPTKMHFKEDGTYIIINGCHNIIDGEYCNGDMICLNWKEGQPSPHTTIYVCKKCHKSKVV